MRVAAAVFNESMPRLFGVDLTPVLDVGELPFMADSYDAVITDREFDSSAYDPSCVCVIGNNENAKRFAAEHRHSCVSLSEISAWFMNVHGIDVTRRGNSTAASANTGDNYKVLYSSLANELRKSGLYDSAALNNDNRLHTALIKQVRDSANAEARFKREIADKDSAIAEKEAIIESLRTELGSADSVRDGLAEAILSEVRNCCENFESIVYSLDELLDKPPEFYSAITKFAAARTYASKIRAVYGTGDFKKLPALSREFFGGLLAVTSDIANGALAAIQTFAAGQQRLDSVPEEISKLKAIAAAAKREAFEANSRCTGLSAQIDSYEAELAQKSDIIVDSNKQYDELVFQYNQLDAYTREIEGKLASSDDISAQYEQALAEKDAALAEYAASYGQAVTHDSSEVEALQSRIDSLVNDLDEKERTIALLRSSTGYGVADSSGVRDGVIRQLRQEVAALKRQLKEALDRAALKSAEARDAVKRADALNQSVQHLGRSVFAGGTVSALPPFEYFGRGFIIPVVGNTSCGITSAAIGLGMGLAQFAPTVIIDFDLVSPDMESHFRPMQNPYTEIAAYGKKSVTAMSVMVERGVDALNKHFNELLRTVGTFKGSRLDYLSGLYGKKDLTVLVEAEYRDFFNFLGAEYSYIVVDCGKLGASEIGDQIIKNIISVSAKTLIVAPGAEGKVRSMRVTLQAALGSDFRRIAPNMVWALVMHRGSDLNKYTEPSKQLSLPMIPSMVGAYASYDADMHARREFKKVVAAMQGDDRR